MHAERPRCGAVVFYARSRFIGLYLRTKTTTPQREGPDLSLFYEHFIVYIINDCAVNVKREVLTIIYPIRQGGNSAFAALCDIIAFEGAFQAKGLGKIYIFSFLSDKKGVFVKKYLKNDYFFQKKVLTKMGAYDKIYKSQMCGIWRNSSVG